MRKVLSLILIPVLLFACRIPPAQSVCASAETDVSFTPVIRFVASSDTHITDSDHTHEERIVSMMDTAYALAEKDAAYPRIDALLVAGDLTNDGTKTEFDAFYAAVCSAIRADTQFLGVVAKNHDGYAMTHGQMREYYRKISGNDADFHTVINGYHFIGISVSPRIAAHYDAKQLKWLKQQLDDAVSDTPDRPVFLMHHEPTVGTVYGSSVYGGWGILQFGALLRNYPQVVDFSGHSHYPVNHPRSIWQGAYTAVNTGAIAYAEFTFDEIRTYHPADSKDVANCWLVEADADGNLRLRGIDVQAGEVLCEYRIADPSDPANREYTPQKQKAKSSPPVFPENTVPEINAGFGGCKIRVPAAVSTDGMPVVLYRAYAKNALGLTADKGRVLAEYYVAAGQDTVELELAGLAAGRYEICVVAENAFGGQSEPLYSSVTVKGVPPVLNGFYRLFVLFKDLKEIMIRKSW